MSSLYCLMGKSSSGKDSIYRELTRDAGLSLRKVIPYTTRPMRSSEADGREYLFVSDERFRQMQAAGQVIESRTYQTVQGPWTYFTADDGQIDIQGKDRYLLVTTLEAYMALRDYYGSRNVLPLYLEVEDGERLERALARERSQEKPDYAEMCRRFLADQEDFSEEKLKEAGILRRYENKSLEGCIREIRETLLGRT